MTTIAAAWDETRRQHLDALLTKVANALTPAQARELDDLITGFRASLADEVGSGYPYVFGYLHAGVTARAGARPAA